MREVVNFIPLKKRENAVFLQIRTDDAPVRPGLLGFFGGGIKEGEGLMKAFFREIPAELSYSPSISRLNFFGICYDEIPTKKHIFYEEVDDSFEKKIIVKEGKGGIFLPVKEVLMHPDIGEAERKALLQLMGIKT